MPEDTRLSTEQSDTCAIGANIGSSAGGEDPFRNCQGSHGITRGSNHCSSVDCMHAENEATHPLKMASSSGNSNGGNGDCNDSSVSKQSRTRPGSKGKSRGEKVVVLRHGIWAERLVG